MAADPTGTDVPLSAVLDLLTERIARYRVDGLTVLYCNRAWARANGASPAELVGRSMSSVLTPAEMTGVVDQVARLSLQVPFLTHNILRSVDRWIEWSDLLLEGPAGLEVLAVGRDVTERQDAELRLAASEERYRTLALRDELTGLANRRLLDELLTSALARSRRHGRCLVVSYLDLDAFKQINDLHGHAVGDEVLREVGRRLQDGVRDADVIARVGGDEFVVVQECPADQARRLTSRLIEVLGAPVHVDGVEIPGSASVGSVIAHPDDDAASLLASADAAMYAVKHRRPRA